MELPGQLTPEQNREAQVKLFVLKLVMEEEFGIEE